MPFHPRSSHRTTAGAHANSNAEAISFDYAGMDVSVGRREARGRVSCPDPGDA
jgi:hypothetical protein